jgi:DNA primase
MAILNKEFKGHAKDRTNAYLALLMLINSKLLKYIPYYDSDDVAFGVETGESEIYRAWIENQNSVARETETGSNNILQLLTGLVSEYVQANKDKIGQLTDELDYEEKVFKMEHKDYNLTIYKTKAKEEQDEDGQKYMVSVVEFVATSAEILGAFNMLSRNTGCTNPFSSAAIFSARLRNDREVLAKSGWVLVESEREKVKPYFKMMRGERFFKFRYTLIR